MSLADLKAQIEASQADVQSLAQGCERSLQKHAALALSVEAEMQAEATAAAAPATIDQLKALIARLPSA